MDIKYGDRVASLSLVYTKISPSKDLLVCYGSLWALLNIRNAADMESEV
jgi:hypothetical protein